MKQNRHFVHKLFMRFFVPALLSSLGLAIGALADCFYIGKMLNEDGLYIIGVASPVYMIFMTWSIALATGGSIHFSRVLGEGDAKRARGICFSTLLGDFAGLCVLSLMGLLLLKPLLHLLGVASDSVYFAETAHYVKVMLLCCPILFMQAPLEYFVHADDAPGRASWSLVMGCVADCLSGYLFIVVMGMGVTGSVLSTLVGAVVMEGICVSHLFSEKGCLRFAECGKLLLRDAVNSLRTGFSTAAQYLYQFAILLAFNRILFRIGTEGAVAVYDVSVNVVSLVTAVTDAVVLAMIPMISTFYGERNRKDMKNCLWCALRDGLLMTGGVSLLLGIFAPWVCGLLGLSAEWIPAGAFAVRLVVLGGVLGCVNIVLTSFFQNIGLERAAFVIVFLRELAVLLLCGLICAKGGLSLFWYAYVITELLVLIGTIIVLLYRRKVQKKTWIPFDTRERVFAETFNGSCEGISDTCERLQEFLEENGASVKQAYFMTLTVDELCRLIAENTGDLMLQLTLVESDTEYVLHIRDNARKFNPLEVRDDDEHGMGLKIVKKQAKEYYYRQFVGFNTLTLSFAKEG